MKRLLHVYNGVEEKVWPFAIKNLFDLLCDLYLQKIFFLVFLKRSPEI